MSRHEFDAEQQHVAAEVGADEQHHATRSTDEGGAEAQQHVAALVSYANASRRTHERRARAPNVLGKGGFGIVAEWDDDHAGPRAVKTFFSEASEIHEIQMLLLVLKTEDAGGLMIPAELKHNTMNNECSVCTKLLWLPVDEHIGMTAEQHAHVQRQQNKSHNHVHMMLADCDLLQFNTEISEKYESQPDEAFIRQLRCTIRVVEMLRSMTAKRWMYTDVKCENILCKTIADKESPLWNMGVLNVVDDCSVVLYFGDYGSLCLLDAEKEYYRQDAFASATYINPCAFLMRCNRWVNVFAAVSMMLELVGVVSDDLTVTITVDGEEEIVSVPYQLMYVNKDQEIRDCKRVNAFIDHWLSLEHPPETLRGRLVRVVANQWRDLNNLYSANPTLRDHKPVDMDDMDDLFGRIITALSQLLPVPRKRPPPGEQQGPARDDVVSPRKMQAASASGGVAE